MVGILIVSVFIDLPAMLNKVKNDIAIFVFHVSRAESLRGFNYIQYFTMLPPDCQIRRQVADLTIRHKQFVMY
jgi:hypothetical protein